VVVVVGGIASLNARMHSLLSFLGASVLALPFPVHALSKVFRGKYLEKLAALR